MSITMLPPRIIGREFIRLLANLRQTVGGIETEGVPAQQIGADAIVSAADLALSLDDFSERILQPIASALSKAIAGRSIIGRMLECPEGAGCARDQLAGVAVRTVICEAPQHPEFPGLKNFALRFDLLVQSAALQANEVSGSS